MRKITICLIILALLLCVFITVNAQTETQSAKYYTNYIPTIYGYDDCYGAGNWCVSGCIDCVGN